MKTWLKWIIGIVIGVLVIGGIAAGMYWMHTNVIAGHAPFVVHTYGPGMMQGRGFDERGLGPGGMMHGGPGFGGRMHGSFGFMPLGGLIMLPLMLLRGLLPLAIVGFAIYGLVTWFKRGKTAPAASMPAPVAPVAAASQAACSNCGQSVQAEWKHCPNCGNTL